MSRTGRELACLLAFFLCGAAAARAEVDPELLKAESARVEMLQKAAAATLSVFSADMPAGGAGVVISPDGFALTNFHVTQPCGNAMKCGMADGRTYDAVIVGFDPTGDVALIKLFGRDDFPHAPLADSDKLRTGDEVFPIGNPFALATDHTPSVSRGIVSGVHRYQPPSGTLIEYTDCIQTDAAINPGNSGGPLFDAQGRVVGINGRCSFDKRGRVNVGVGYAISINQIKNFMGYLKSGRVVDHATLGAVLQSDENGAAVVADIIEDSDAYRRGLRYDDEVIAFGGRPVRSVNDYKNTLGIFPKGWRVPITFRHKGQTSQRLVRLEGMHHAGELTRPGRRKLFPLPPVPDPNKDQDEDGQEKKKRDRLKKLHKMFEEMLKRKKAPMPEVVKKHFKARSGYANYYFNELAQKRIWKAFTAGGDFSAATGTWLLKGKSAGDKTAGDRVELSIAAERISARLPGYQATIEFKKGAATLREPPGSGGFLPAMRLWRRLLVKGPAGYEDVHYLGTAPLRDFDGLADVLVGLYEGVSCRFYFNPNNGRLLCMEMFPEDDVDPCEVYFRDYKKQDGRMVPGRLVVYYGHSLFGDYEIASFNAPGEKQKDIKQNDKKQKEKK